MKSVISPLLFTYSSTGDTGLPLGEWSENALHATLNMLQLKEIKTVLVKMNNNGNDDNNNNNNNRVN